MLPTAMMPFVAPPPSRMAAVYLGTTGLRVSRFCLGTMNFCEGGVAAAGAASSVPAHKTGEEEAHAILDAFCARGGNFIDTADIYNGGATERVIGRWLAARPAMRAKIVLLSKARGVVDEEDPGPNDEGLSRAHLPRALDASLARLCTSYLDICTIRHNRA